MIKNLKNKVVCALLGHSKIVTGCFGYVYCARCGEQIGDALGGCFDASKVVIVGHNCPTCQKNYKKLTWKDKIFCPNPFKQEGLK
jgi:DNA-directed RNA polymerase subunit RPC12/RpoP